MLAIDGVELEQDAGAEGLRGCLFGQVAQDLADGALLVDHVPKDRICGELELDAGALAGAELVVEEGLDEGDEAVAGGGGFGAHA